MKKFSSEWFIEQAQEAQNSVAQWPPEMQRNNVVAVAALPTHKPPRPDKSAEDKPQAPPQPDHA